MSAETRRRAAKAAGLLIVAALLLFAVRRLDVARVVVELRSVRPVWIAAALVAFAAVLPLWALQWRILAPPVPNNRFAAMLGVVAVSSTMLSTTVLLMGEAAEMLLLVTRIGLTKSAALSVFAMDQLLVGLAKLVVLAIAVQALALPAWMSVGVTALAAGVIVLLVTLLIIAWRHGAMASYAERVLPARAAEALTRAAEALAPLRSMRRSGAAFVLALAKMATEAMAIYCVQRAFGVALPVSSAIAVLAALSIATAVPVVPGHVGTFEAVVVFVYVAFGITPERALGIALVMHACRFAALALPGYRWVATSSSLSASR